MRVVLDTNVIIASFASRGLCHSIFEICLDRTEIIISSFLMKELKTNLSKKLHLPQQLITDIIEFLSKNAISIEIDTYPKDICRDTDDAKVLALACKSNAAYLITGDKELLDLKKYKDTKIISPRQFWGILKKQKPT